MKQCKQELREDASLDLKECLPRDGGVVLHGLHDLGGLPHLLRHEITRVQVHVERRVRVRVGRGQDRHHLGIRDDFDTYRP